MTGAPTLPPVTRCRNCGLLAAETVCHLCMTPRPGFEKPPDLRAPMDKVCDSCGTKHTGPFTTCAGCQRQP